MDRVWSEAKEAPVAVVPEHAVVNAFQRVAACAGQMSQAADEFIRARDRLNAARDEYALAMDVVAKEREQAGV